MTLNHSDTASSLLRPVASHAHPRGGGDGLPPWLPPEVRIYLAHVEGGKSLRAIARAQGMHPSTVMRQVRRFENRRDDPLIDDALGRLCPDPVDPAKEARLMTNPPTRQPQAAPPPDDETLTAEARRILRRMAEPGALMAVAADMARAVVLREGEAGTVRLAVLERPVAEAFALRGWITCRKPGRVARYEITAAGRAEHRRLLAEAEETESPEPDAACRRIPSESPVAMLARRRDRNNRPFLTADLVAAAERLREDFEIAQMEPGLTQDWSRFLTAGVQAGARRPGAGGRSAPAAARARVLAALRDLGPGLGDVALRCCCYLEGLETAERRQGWSARSGKIVLRIALMRLQQHYADLGEEGQLMC